MLVLAHGQQLAPFLYAWLFGFSLPLGVLSLVLARAKRRDRISVPSLILGVASVAQAVYTIDMSGAIATWNVFTLAIIAAAIPGVIGTWRALRFEKGPNKAPEPTPGAVTPRATEGDSR